MDLVFEFDADGWGGDVVFLVGLPGFQLPHDDFAAEGAGDDGLRYPYLGVKSTMWHKIEIFIIPYVPQHTKYRTCALYPNFY